MPRIVACMMCHKLERIPDVSDSIRRVPATVSWDDHGAERDYTFKHEDGSTILVPEFDPVLEDVVGRHGHDRPDTEVMQFIKVFPVDQATYEKMDVVTELKKELAEQTGEFFEEATYYRDEAVKCYNQHHNPQGTCIDYLDDSKRLGSSEIPKQYQTFLCHMCPIQQSYINVELRHRAGYYDPKKATQLANVRNRHLRRIAKKR